MVCSHSTHATRVPDWPSWHPLAGDYFVCRGSALKSSVSDRGLGWCGLVLRLTALHRGRQEFPESKRVGSILRKSSSTPIPCFLSRTEQTSASERLSQPPVAGRGRGQASNSGPRVRPFCPGECENSSHKIKWGFVSRIVGAMSFYGISSCCKLQTSGQTCLQRLSSSNHP